MKISYLFITAFVFLVTACNNNDKQPLRPDTGSEKILSGEKYAAAINNGSQTDTLKTSVSRLTKWMVDSSVIEISYHSPGVRGRIIWGGLVPFDQVWVTGAHSATRISFTSDMVFGNTVVPAGTYAIFTIPGKTEWVFILNKNFEQHLADDYKQQEDIVRINVQPELLQDTLQRLTYTIKENGEGSGSIAMQWEKIEISVPFNILKQSTGLQGMMGHRKKLIGIKPGNKRDPVCYMPVTAGITDTFTYKNVLYGFCAPECKKIFEEDPQAYLSKALQ